MKGPCSHPGTAQDARARTAWIATGLAALVFAAFLFAIRDTTPELTESELRAARARWESQELPDYDLVLLKELDARPAEHVEVSVRARKVTRLAINGTEVSALESYSIPALFTTAERELEMASQATPLPGQPRGSQLRARFHETLGAPLKLRRIASGRQSYFLTVERIALPGGKTLWP